MSDLEDLQQKIVTFRDQRNWKQFHNPKDLAISLSLEASELLEHFQWKTPKEIKKHLAENKEDVAEELADVLYWVLLIANDMEIDVMSASERKLDKNNTKYPVEKSRDSHKKYTEL